MPFVNLTPHAIVIFVGKENIVTLAPSGGVARCTVVSEAAGTFAGVLLTRTKMGEVVGLPAPEPGVLYIVSMIVRSACADRIDVASPGELVRDSQGKPIGCKGLVVN